MQLEFNSEFGWKVLLFYSISTWVQYQKEESAAFGEATLCLFTRSDGSECTKAINLGLIGLLYT